MKNHSHYGAYGLFIKDGKILLIKKVGGPYDGKLDLPGGTIEFAERPSDALIREIKEETSVSVTKYELFDVDKVMVIWKRTNDDLNVSHMGVFYKILSYDGEIDNNVKLDDDNNDSLGALWKDINKLHKGMLSKIAIMELEKMGYVIKE